MGLSIRKLGSRLYDQVNMFDNNRTFKQRTPTQKKSAVQQGGQVVGQTARGMFSPIAKTVNTGAAAVNVAGGLGNTLRVSLLGSDQDYKKTVNAMTRNNDRFLNPGSGLLGTGSWFKNKDEATNIGTKDLAGRVLGGGAETYLAGKSLKMGGFTGKKLVEEGFKKGIKTQLPNLARNAGVNTLEGIARGRNEGQSWKDAAKTGVASGALGTVGDVGLGVLGAGARGALTPAARKLLKDAPRIKPSVKSKPFVINEGVPTVQPKKPLEIKAGVPLARDPRTPMPKGLKVVDNSAPTSNKLKIVDRSVPRQLSGAAQQSNLARADGAVTARMMRDYIEGKPPVNGSGLSGDGAKAPVSLSPSIKKSLMEQARAKVQLTKLDDRGAIAGPQESPILKAITNAKTRQKQPQASSIDPSDPFGNKNLLTKIRNEAGSLVDDDAQMITLLKKIEKESGREGLVDQWMFDSGNVRASTSIANAKLKNSEDLSGALRGLSKQDLDEFDTYMAARAELKNYDGMPTSRTPEQNAAIVQAGDAKFGERFTYMNNFYKKQAQDMYDGGLITKEQLQAYQASDDYVRIQRDMEDLVNTTFGGSRSRSIGTTTAGQKRIGSEREILSPTASAAKRTQQLQLEIQRNKAATNTLNILEEVGLAKNLVNADDVVFRRDMYKFLKDTKEGKVLTDRLLKTDQRQLRKLETEVNNLNKRGLEVSLKNRETPSKPVVTSKLKITKNYGLEQGVESLKQRGRWKVEQPIDIRSARTNMNGSKYLNSVTGETTDALKKYAKANKLSEDEALVRLSMKRNGVDAYNFKGKEVVLNDSKVKSEVKNLVGNGTAQGDVVGASANQVGMTATRTKQTIESLLTSTPSELQRIRNKLALREPRLAELVDEVARLRDTSEAFRTARSEAYNAALARADIATKNKNTVKRIRDGITEVYEVPGDIKKVIDNVSPYQLGVIARVISAPTRLFRAGTTALSAPFTVTNYLRDQASSGLYSKSIIDTHNPKNIIQGLGSAARDFAGESQHPLWKKFEEFSGDQTIFDELRNAQNTKRLFREIRRGEAGKVGNMVTQPIRTLEDLNSVTEKATRFQNFKGIYEKTLKATGNEQEAIKAAVLAARQNSVDFQRSSSFTRAMNLFIPYFNAGVQGSRNVARSFRDRPLSTAMKSVGYIAAPSVVLTAYNLSDPDRRAAYDSINEFEKEDNFIIVGPNPKQNEDGSWEGIYKIPKPQGYRELTDPVRDVSEAFMKGESVENVAGMFKDMLGGLTGPIDVTDGKKFAGGLIPQAAKPWIQSSMNQDLYTGNDIVPEYMMDETDDATKRAFRGTSGTARLIANQIGVSPIKVERIITDITGSLGRYGINASDNALAATGKIPEEQIGGRSMKTDFSRRLFEASGQLLDENKSPGRRYFENIKTVSEGLNKNELAAFNSLHPSKTNFLGEDIFDENKRITNYTRAGAYINNPGVLEADRKLDQLQRDQGKPGNPLFDLPNPLLTKVLLKAALPPGSKDPELSNLYKQEWYQDYQNARSKYYEGVKSELSKEGKSMPKSTNPYPTTPGNLQKVMDTYSSLPKGTGARSSWIKANPGLWQQMTAQWAQVDAWENKERVAIGLAPVEDEDDASTSKYGSGSGGGGGSIGYAGRSKVSAKGTIAKPKISTKSPGKLQGSVKYTASGKPKVTIKKALT